MGPLFMNPKSYKELVDLLKKQYYKDTMIYVKDVVKMDANGKNNSPTSSVPGGIISGDLIVSDSDFTFELPEGYFFTGIDYAEDPRKPEQMKECNHIWKDYVGLQECFQYCEKCDEKRK